MFLCRNAVVHYVLLSEIVGREQSPLTEAMLPLPCGNLVLSASNHDTPNAYPIHINTLYVPPSAKYGFPILSRGPHKERRPESRVGMPRREDDVEAAYHG